MTMVTTPTTTLCLLAFLAAIAATEAAGDGTTTTHLHFYEKFLKIIVFLTGIARIS
jgi:hypothetical protein